MGSDNRVTVQSRMSVVPTKPTPLGRVHPLSMLDHMMQLHTVRSVYYFGTSSVLVKEEGGARDKVMEALKDSLCKALCANPVYAGRLRKREEDGMWEVKCNDAGVRVYEAVAAVSLEECLRCSDLELEFTRTEVNANHTVSPLAIVQFTHFSCGGLAIGLSWLHIIGDPLCGNLLMKAWGETYRAAQVLHPPFLHPPSLRPRPAKVNNADVSSRRYYTSAFLGSRSADADASQDYRTVFLSFPHHVMEDCVGEVQNGSCKFGPASPTDVLSALLWVAVLRAQGRAEHDDARLSLCLEFRKIHVPPVPYGYMGNAVHFVGVSSSVGELVNRDLSFATSLIHEEVAMSDTEEVRSVIDLLQELEEQGDGICTKKPAHFYSAGLTICHFDHFFCYDVFFDFGKPVRVGCTVQPWTGEGLVLILPAPEGRSSRNAVITLPRDVMGPLLQDPDIVRLAQISGELVS